MRPCGESVSQAFSSGPAGVRYHSPTQTVNEIPLPNNQPLGDGESYPS
jgi:hypothetical protein